jgi:zinc/manganese transport system substrate-binding protein
MRKSLTLALGALAVLANCGEDAASGDDRPSIVVTTNILGDVVGAVVGDAASVEVVMPVGADPHDFAASARQAEAMADADLLVQNGAGFEEGMADVIDNAADGGAELFTFADHVDLIGDDPHVWTDPSRVVAGVEALGARLADLEGIDAAAVSAQTAAYLDALAALESDLDEALAAVPAERRVLVTDHEVFAYFAERFAFDVVGTVIPATTTDAAPSAADLDALAQTIRDVGVPAIFTQSGHSDELADALAAEVGDVEVVALFGESLGDEGSGAETYLDMMRTNAELIVGALT